MLTKRWFEVAHFCIVSLGNRSELTRWQRCFLELFKSFFFMKTLHVLVFCNLRIMTRAQYGGKQIACNHFWLQLESGPLINSEGLRSICWYIWCEPSNLIWMVQIPPTAWLHAIQVHDGVLKVEEFNLGNEIFKIQLIPTCVILSFFHKHDGWLSSLD